MMIGDGSRVFIVTVETSTAIHYLLSAQEEGEEFVKLTVGSHVSEFPKIYYISGAC